MLLTVGLARAGHVQLHSIVEIQVIACAVDSSEAVGRARDQTSVLVKPSLVLHVFVLLFAERAARKTVALLLHRGHSDLPRHNLFKRRLSKRGLVVIGENHARRFAILIRFR